MKDPKGLFCLFLPSYPALVCFCVEASTDGESRRPELALGFVILGLVALDSEFCHSEKPIPSIEIRF